MFEDSLIVEFGTDRLIWGFHFADKVVGRFEGEMSEVFEGYERQYCELSANLSRKCSSSGLLDGGKKKERVVYLYKVLENCASIYYGSTHAYFSVISLFCYAFFDHYMLVRLPFVLPV